MPTTASRPCPRAHRPFPRPHVKHLPDHLPLGKHLSLSRCLTIADKILRRSEIEDRALVFDTSRTGQARRISFYNALLLLLAFKLQNPKRDMLLADVIRWTDGVFTATHWQRLGLDEPATYGQLQTSFKGLCDLLEPEASFHRVDLVTGEIVRPRRAHLPSLDEVVNRIVGSSIPKAIPPTDVLAIDSTDVETHAARRGWPDKPDVEHADEMPPGDDATPEKSKRDPDWPKAGPDGRSVTSADPDARLGWRTVKNQSGSSIFNGYDLHLLVDAGTAGRPSQPYFIRGMALRPAGAYKPDACFAILDTMPGGFPGRVLAADRGYSQALAENYHFGLQDRGISYVHDLRQNQRSTRVSSKKGTFWLDGDLYVEAMPAELRKLPNYSIGMTAPAQAKLRAKYDRRIPYAFSPNTRVRDDGSVQLKGPARARKLACGNYPPSANAPIPTNCAPSEQCACASTVVIPRHEAARERQLHPFGSTRWSEIYGMRSAVESDNAQLKIWRGSIRRHSTHVFGTTANALLLALHCAAVNVSMLHDAYDGAVTINSTSSARVPTKRQRPEARAALHRQRRPGKTRPPARGTNGHQRPAR